MPSTTDPPYVNDPDFTLCNGDVRDVLPTLPADSVDCVVTSPPYWSLRDYGVAGQLGLEPTPDEYVTSMVAVFREVRRVLRPHGTCWVNIGDSYNANTGRGFDTNQDGDKNGKKAAAALTQRIPWGKPKDLVGIPWLLAFALRADGWYLRSEIIWAKSNPMPESVTDRPTKAHEQVFLLSKSPRYWYDAGTGRNARTVWEIATEPYPDAHFATFPTELARRCILAGCPEQVCGTCGKARERIIDNRYTEAGKGNHNASRKGTNEGRGRTMASGVRMLKDTETLGWSDCGHDSYRPGVVLDPFLGSGTVAWVARHHGRRSIGVELSADYCDLAAKRMQQLSLLAEGAA